MALKTWGDFEVNTDRLLGKGGMGAVYMGRQISLDRPAAIKVLKGDLTSNPEFVKRFHREAALLARIVDNHVVQIFGAGEAEGQHFYAMEYVEGEDYASRVRSGHKFSLEEVLKVGESVGIALQQAWRHRIIHRDIKPSNILLTKDNETKVMDFGLAKDPESDMTASEVIMGTAKYMSPEQATGGACDIRSDMYSLGVVLYELATGKPPFTGEGATAIMYQHVHKQPKPPREIDPSIPEPVEKMILRLMAKDPDARYAGPDALIAAIRNIQDGVTSQEKDTLYEQTIKMPEGHRLAQPDGSVAPTPSPSRTDRNVLLGVAVLAMAAAVAFVIVKNSHKPIPVALRPDPALPATKADPPRPVPDPSKPPPEEKKPESKVEAWMDLKKAGLEKFSRKEWSESISELSQARSKGARDLDETIDQAKANLETEKGDKSVTDGNEDAALRYYEAASAIKNDDALQVKMKAIKFKVLSKDAEKSEGGDWFKAAADWKRALEVAPESEVDETRARFKFCDTFSQAVNSGVSRNWRKSRELYGELSQNPRGQAAAIEAGLKKADAELAREEEMETKKARSEFDAFMASGADLMKKAIWVEAKKVLDEASKPRYKDCPQADLIRSRETVLLALAAPAGMIYVPGGKFLMGGGRAVESPAGEAEVGAFYMDEQEVRVAEYVEFIKTLDSFGHTPFCLKAEPPNKKHVPLDWETQKPEDAVAGVDWWDAASFASWRRKRLPTEAEWERAAGFDANGRRLYPWGAKYQKEDAKSYLGFGGMSSGVIEWTGDWFNHYPWSKAEHPDFGEKRRVVRGGVLLAEDAPEATKVTYRYWYLPQYRSRKLGFRCVQDMPEK